MDSAIFLQCYGLTCVASDGDVEGCLTGVYINSVY